MLISAALDIENILEKILRLTVMHVLNARSVGLSKFKLGIRSLVQNKSLRKSHKY